MIKVTNRSDEIVTYTLPEMNIRRVFTPGSYKDLEPAELAALAQTDGGLVLLRDSLLVEDEEWVIKNLGEPPIEYFWTEEDVKRCVFQDPVDLFSETLDYAPEGIKEMIKRISWEAPLSDMNKINLIREKLGFDVQAAINIMEKGPAKEVRRGTDRLRKRD